MSGRPSPDNSAKTCKVSRKSTTECSSALQNNKRSSAKQRLKRFISLHANGIEKNSIVQYAEESHEHLFFCCHYSRAVLRVLKAKVRFEVPLFEWKRIIMWVARHWRGRHPWNASSRALFASLVYHPSARPPYVWNRLDRDLELNLDLMFFFGGVQEPASGDLDGGTEETAVGTNFSFVNRLKSVFNMEEFLMLANKVIEDGDTKSWDTLHDLKTRWEAKVGPLHRTLPRPHTIIDENPMVRSFRMARRTLVPLLPRRDTVPMEEAPLMEGEAPPNPNPRKEALLDCDVTHDAPALFMAGFSPAHQEGVLNPSMEFSSTLPNIFIGKIPLHSTPPIPPPKNRFAEAFNNSTRRTLRFIQPARQNGEVVVRPTMAMVHAGSRKWETTAVGYFLGRKPPFHQVQTYFHSIWPDVRDVIATINSFFFISFKTMGAMDDAIDGGPWLFQGHPFVLQRWEPGMALRKHSHTQVPVWIKLRHLPVELWTEDGLSTIASGVGKPLYPDSIMKTCTRLDFAHVFVMLDFNRNPTSGASDADGDDDDTAIRDLNTNTDSIGDKVRQEFTFSDFHSLATRVLDRDEASLEKLESLKQQWKRRFPFVIETWITVCSTTFAALPIEGNFHASSINSIAAYDWDRAESSRKPQKENLGQENHGQEPVPNSSPEPGVQIQSPQQSVEPGTATPELFVGNIKINMSRTDTIADGFLNSTRKTLRFIPPENQNDEIIIKPSIAMVERGSEHLRSTAVGYFLGKKPFFPQLEAFARTNWKGLQHVSATANGFYFFTFKTPAFMEEVIPRATGGLTSLGARHVIATL
ncbi:UNVERIFIED_CONTAM: hypothetical protein Slati_0886900 [Sesamum latifolium]|uniref:DUF4283 domain-containing protein n=1 Tax=Sesamum latifolium TaxID=2727402 RepID=A0AAW2XRB8_9LAMI